MTIVVVDRIAVIHDRVGIVGREHYVPVLTLRLLSAFAGLVRPILFMRKGQSVPEFMNRDGLDATPALCL
jgi:hypothetical protein